MENCTLCGSELLQPSQGITLGDGGTIFECPQCGKFIISFQNNSDSSWSSIYQPNKHLIAGYLFETRNSTKKETVIINRWKIEEILKSPHIPRKSQDKKVKIL